MNWKPDMPKVKFPHPIEKLINDLQRQLTEAQQETERLKATLAIADEQVNARDTRIAEVVSDNARLRQDQARLVELLRYVAFQRLPLGNTVIETLPDHYQHDILDALRLTAESEGKK